MNQSLARVYLEHCDPKVKDGTWRDVAEELILSKPEGENRTRWTRR